MKKLYCYILAALLLLGMMGCRGSKAPDTPDTLEPLTYTDVPTQLTAQKLGILTRQAVPAAGGLYYQESGKYGIITLDGKHDTGPIYTHCQPSGSYFMVSNGQRSSAEDPTELNNVGIVDATGKELVPLAFAQVSTIDERFARVVKITGFAETEDERQTYYLDSNNEQVNCKGTWHLYDLQTGKEVPGATGTSRYAAYSYGSYVKYVTDDKQVIVCTPDGEPIPDEAIHLKNGYYVLEAEHAVYDGNRTRLFTYDPNGYVPCDSQGVSGYIMAKKTVDGNDSYALMDLTGKVVTAGFEQQPSVCGELLCVNGRLVRFDGTAVIDGTFDSVYWESVFGQSWVVTSGQTRQIVKKDGTVMGTGNGEDSVVDPNRMLIYKTVDDERKFFCFADNDFTLTGTALAPFVVKSPGENSTYDLVNVLTGETILSGYSNYTSTDINAPILYVYAQNADGVWEIFALR